MEEKEISHIEEENNSNEKINASSNSRCFPCTYDKCIKIYKSKENLVLHVKNIHLKEKPYQCRYCSAVFFS